MKLALGPLGVMLVGAAAILGGAGCGASGAQRAPVVGTTEVSSVTFTLSRLAPATWDGDEFVAPARAPAQTWGGANANANANAKSANGETAPELMATP